MNRLGQRGPPARKLGRLARRASLGPSQNAHLEELVLASGLGKRNRLLEDGEDYETEVAKLVERASPEQLADLAELRQIFHLNVMNPALELVSTRQLLADFPLRLVVGLGDEKLDLYCAILERDERYLVLDLNVPEEVLRILARRPRCDLVFWRENRGETLFSIRLEQVPSSGDLPVFRAAHVMRADEPWQRADFRLTVETPVRYTYMGREALRRAESGPEEEPGAVTGEGKLLDLSFGGAAFSARRPLAPKGFVQLHFEVNQQPMRLMLEVLSSEPYGERMNLVRGRLRGMQSEGRALMNSYLSREQERRLRGRETFHVKPRG